MPFLTLSRYVVTTSERCDFIVESLPQVNCLEFCHRVPAAECLEDYATLLLDYWCEMGYTVASGPQRPIIRLHSRSIRALKRRKDCL